MSRLPMRSWDTPWLFLGKKMMFDVVATQVHIVWENTVVDEVMPHVFAAMVKIVLPLSTGGGQREELFFHGDWLGSVGSAVESAYGVVPKHLKDSKCVILIDDSYDELIHTRTQLSAMRFCADTFEEACVAARAEVVELKCRIMSLKNKLMAICRRHAHFLCISTDAAEASTVNVGSVPAASSVQYIGSALPVTDIERLSSSIIDIIHYCEGTD